MTEISPIPTRAFVVRVEDFRADERFAVEDFSIEAAEGKCRMALARARSEDSVYFDERVPDLRRAIAVEPLNDDPAPPPLGGGALKSLCPDRSSDEIARDACAARDSETQDWSLIGVYDSETTVCDADLLRAGALRPRFGEKRAAWLAPLKREGFLVRRRHPGNHIHVFQLTKAARLAAGRVPSFAYPVSIGRAPPMMSRCCRFSSLLPEEA
ncbi:hypothetical protein [Sphingomonas koreensis]